MDEMSRALAVSKTKRFTILDAKELGPEVLEIFKCKFNSRSRISVFNFLRYLASFHVSMRTGIEDIVRKYGLTFYYSRTVTPELQINYAFKHGVLKSFVVIRTKNGELPMFTKYDYEDFKRRLKINRIVRTISKEGFVLCIGR